MTNNKEVTTIYADFHNADELGLVRLNTAGTAEDIAILGIELTDGLSLLISDGEVEAEGIVRWSDEEHIWVVEIDWDRVRDMIYAQEDHVNVEDPD